MRGAARACDVQVQTTDDGIMLRLPDLGAAPADRRRSARSAPTEAERLVLEEVGQSSLFGARFRMNAARALLLPRGNPRRRMPLWLQRLKSLDLLQAVREFPSFPILVETYRDVLQDAFDMPALRDVLGGIASGAITDAASRATEIPSPFAQSLQFGFVIDWMYGDDAPRAEQRAALLSLDRALLDELMGGEGADDATLAVLSELLARRRGTAPGRQARDADELALLLDRAGDLTRAELEARVAPSTSGGAAIHSATLLAGRRDRGHHAAHRERSRASASSSSMRTRATARRSAPMQSRRSAQASASRRRRRQTSFLKRCATPCSPTEPLGARCSRGSSRSSGPVSIRDVRDRYDFDAAMDPAPARGVGAQRACSCAACSAATAPRRAGARAGCSSRRAGASSRRRASRSRPCRSTAFARFVQRWQHLTPDSRVSGIEGTATVLGQLYGVARPGDGWERDYLPSRIEGYDAGSLARLAASGALVWAAEPRVDEVGVAPSHAMGRIRFFERGTGRLWLREPIADSLLGDSARAVRDVLRAQGASFTADLAAATGLGPHGVRDALRELVASGLVTNDTVEALRDVLRWRPRFPVKRPNEPDPTRWLPAGFTPSAGRPIVQRRINPRRLAKWKRPDREEAASWGGRWSLVHTLGTLGVERDEQELARPRRAAVAARYGIVSRDWWRREQPAVGWREIYHELKRLEFRGEVQRGYFVAGLAGAQFALPEAVEMLRAPVAEGSDDVVVMSTTDPANVYALPLAPGTEADPLARPRGAGALLVTRSGRIVLAAEGRGAKLRVGEGATMDDVREAAHALAVRLTQRQGTGRRRDVIVESIDGERAAGSRYATALRDAGFKGMGTGLRWYAGLA